MVVNIYRQFKEAKSDTLSCNLAQDHFLLWTRFMGIMECIENNVDHLATASRTLDVRIFIDHEKQIMQVATNAKMLCMHAAPISRTEDTTWERTDPYWTVDTEGQLRDLLAKNKCQTFKTQLDGTNK